MNAINPKKLLNSKWTALAPKNKEKHFIVSEVLFNDDGAVISCVIEAVLTHRQQEIDWKNLKNSQQWLQGW
jgi:tryptophan-rich hypothetical protein